MPIFPIVGAHYRPPAKALLQSLPHNQPLFLRKEPSNPFDQNAIMVLVSTSTIPPEIHPILATLAGGYGFDLPTILSQPEWHLGYIPRDKAKALGNAMSDGEFSFPECPCTLASLSTGAPAIQVKV